MSAALPLIARKSREVIVHISQVFQSLKFDSYTETENMCYIHYCQHFLKRFQRVMLLCCWNEEGFLWRQKPRNYKEKD